MGMIPKNKKYYSSIQIRMMKKLFPQFRAIKRGEYDIEFIGDLKVMPIFPTYTLSIHYRGDQHPIIRVLHPDLAPKTPHFYKASKSLCLYHPKDFIWRKEKLIAREIVQWAAAWIYFYQVWLEKGRWLGPEAKHY